jgi:hypothetical protein
MTVTTLPTNVYPLDGLEWSVIGRGGLLRPLSGGRVQFQGRIGDMMACTGQLPPMDRDCAAAWVSALFAQRRGQTVRWTLPAPYGLTGAGTPRVNGADQQGSSLITDGWTVGFVIPDQTPFNVPDADGRPYLHFTEGSVTANGSGQATLTFGPMLRIVPADNALIEVAAPKIEGWLNDAGVRWSVERLEFYSVPFAIGEDQ